MKQIFGVVTKERYDSMDLQCPKCGSIYLHLPSDMKPKSKPVFSLEHLKKEMADQYHCERGVHLIRFVCEDCDANPVLCIAGHAGCVNTRWVYEQTEDSIPTTFKRHARPLTCV
jgi:hypothetical protein